jgi:hypothetical protein
MWLYRGPSDPDRSSSEELSEEEMNSWVLKILDLGVNLQPRAGTIPLRAGVANNRVS